ncbi:MAG: SCO family protein [Myxococcales bacterium]|nr:SCO family protein [Myxococcales bacterium]MCB9610299.1 SCO family protein [Polyangiaceae bacterium]
MVLNRCVRFGAVLGVSVALLSSLQACDRGSGEQAPAAIDLTPKEESKELAKLGDIGNFKLTDQTGKTVTRETLKGEPFIAAFFFTRCPTICPRLTRKMREVQSAGKAEDLKFRLVSFSVDPENDSPEELKKYAEKNSVDLSNWVFLTGDYEVVKQTSVGGFKQVLEGKADPNADHFGILHGSHLVLVDGEAQIRGFYRSEDDDAVKRLLSDIKRLGS